MTVEKTQYYNLDKPEKGTVNWHLNLNENFDKIDTKLYEQYDRLNKVITTPIDSEGSAQELVDARNNFPTLGSRLNNIDNTIETNKINANNKIEDVKTNAVRSDITDEKTGDLIMVDNSGIIFGGKIKFCYNSALGSVDIITI
jgi:hypothetical protein